MGVGETPFPVSRDRRSLIPQPLGLYQRVPAPRVRTARSIDAARCYNTVELSLMLLERLGFFFFHQGIDGSRCALVPRCSGHNYSNDRAHRLYLPRIIVPQ